MRPNDSYWQGDGIPKIARGTFDGAQWSWETFNLDTQNAYALRSLAVHPTNAERIFGGDETLGMLRTLDHGQSWTPVNQGLDAVIVYDVDVDDNDTAHMIVGSGSGLFERPAGSLEWHRRHNGIFHAVRFQPRSSTTYYGGSIDFVARTTDNGATWSYSNLLGPSVFDIVVDPVDPDTLYIATHEQVLHSNDGGDNFTAVLDGINRAGQAYLMNTVVIDLGDHTHLFAGGGRFYMPRVHGDLWESFDSGATWQRTGLSDVIVNAVLVDPRDSNLLYAGCGYSYNYEPPLYKSQDGGATWTEMSNGLANQRFLTWDIWADNYDLAVAHDLTVTGSDVTWCNFDMQPGIFINTPGTDPDNSGGADGGGYCFVGTTWLHANVFNSCIIIVPMLLIIGAGILMRLKNCTMFDLKPICRH